MCSLTKTADKLAEKAEYTSSHKFFIESNALHYSAKKKKKQEQLATLALEIHSNVTEICGL